MTERTKRWIAYYGPTALLCVVAGFQMTQLTIHPERPRWKGGGFGMYSELYDLRHFCRFREEVTPEFPSREYETAVRSFLASGREEEISRLYDDLTERAVPIERVIVVRKRLTRGDDNHYRLLYVLSHAYPASAEGTR